MLRDVTVIVDAIADAEPVEPCTEIEEHAKLPAHARLTEQHPARHAPQMPVAGKPAIVLVLDQRVLVRVTSLSPRWLTYHRSAYGPNLSVEIWIVT